MIFRRSPRKPVSPRASRRRGFHGRQRRLAGLALGIQLIAMRLAGGQQFLALGTLAVQVLHLLAHLTQAGAGVAFLAAQFRRRRRRS